MIKHIPKFEISAIDNNEQAYNTVGDYGETKPGHWWIKTSKFSSQIYELALAVHEMIELVLCLKAGITDEDILAFDKAHPEDDNPGQLKDAPYHKQHMIAEQIENLIIVMCGGSLPDYWEECDKHFNTYKNYENKEKSQQVND